MAVQRGSAGRARRGGGVGPALGRRALLRAGAAAAAGAAAVPWLAACSAAGARTPAAPTPAGAVITLVFQPYTSAYGFADTGTLNQILQQATQPFLDQNPGIRLTLYGPAVNPVAAVIAGAGPDVPQLQGGGGGIFGWLQGPFLLDLQPYVQQSNVDLSNFSAGQLADVTRGGALYGIPNYTGTAAVAVNEAALDALGLSYPRPDWTYTDWATLAASASGTAQNGQRRYGTTIDSDSFGSGPGAFYYHGWGADLVDPADPTHCALGSAEAIACGEFLYGLVQNQSAQFGWVPPGFAQGLCAAPFCWLQTYIIPAATQWRSFKWDFWPQPLWPKGAFTMTNPNFYAISSTSQHPDQAWELVQWLTVQPDWQRIMMRAVLLPPGYLPLWEEWTAIVRQVAPPLADKNLDVFAQSVKNGIMTGGTHFAYNDPQAKQIVTKGYAAIAAGRSTVAETFPQIAQQIDALEQAAAAEAATGATLAKRFPTSGPALAGVATGS